VNADEDTVKILCEWAVSTHRWGEHRAMAVARLLDKRQSEVLMNENDNVDDKDSDFGYSGTPIFQGILLRFLDSAPVLEENGTTQNKNQFKNLVHLFSELIRNDVFSHDAYMCTLISRGDLLNIPSSFTSSISSVSKSVPSNINQQPQAGGSSSNTGNNDDDFFSEIDFKPKMEEFDDSNVDDDLEKLIQNIKDGQNNSMDNPDSPKENENLPTLPSITNDKSSSSTSSAASYRHYLYTMHFPLSQDDASQHDCNQRYVLLYGVGKERDERKHSVKKMSKEICKLFSKKFSIDVAEGGKVKKHSRNEFNFESTLTKCQTMCYFDQHFVTWQCAVTVQEMLNSFANGNSNYLPVAEHVAFLFDLMEVALNIYGVIDMCIQILKELPDVEAQLMAKSSILVKNYTTTLSLYVVGILRRYNSCLLLSPDQTTAVFEGLCKVVKHVSNPSDCTSAERCILAYLYDLYLACSILLKKPPSEPFHNAYPKIKQTIYAPIKLSQIPQQYNPQFMSDVLANPKRGGKNESNWGRQLSESPMNRYSFVCNAIIAICRESDNDKLNDIAIMCAELTACCNSLSAEFIGALGALCNTKNESGYYAEILNAVDLQNVHIYNSIAVFTCILIGT
jgi:mediator of RNA polymerase II transcription subunit 12